MILDQDRQVDVTPSLILSRVKNSTHYVLVYHSPDVEPAALLEWTSDETLMKWILKVFNAFNTLRVIPEKIEELSPAIKRQLNELLEKLENDSVED